MKHLVKDKKDVIFEGLIYRPDRQGFVELPKEVRTDTISPMVDDESDNLSNNDADNNPTDSDEDPDEGDNELEDANNDT